ncbi:efflux RND transporter periplasmic adaptor subunit [Desulfoprunum benzoelyticum]|uniref:HlyD family secretion protein n=1 Tax=Desulfoprunum benzoelyticum TaxID=1506996 RepID=A0A840UVP8_9BACT|nr:efflux RND transporter periplasmic adaptor subunit [Desulfoprunum benzoelyticum]MBB5346798.1 HlyD family secretion protein [Desulfoprunum benzoelyticum]MBM9531131.1 efflux RND transporter periplasmic adaptor subunit [Desulfoprunum benzoelyticum]
MNKRIRIVLVVVVLVVVAVFVYTGLNHRDDFTSLTVSGNIEVTEIRMSFRIPGKLDQRLVEEGDAVSAGQPLARLDATDQRIAVARAEADLAYAGAVLAELLAGSRSQEIETARAEYDRAVALEKSAIVQLEQARLDHDRYAVLYTAGGVSRKAFENYRTLHETAKNARDEAHARVAAAAELLDLRKTGPRRESIDQARAKAGTAEEAVKQARQQLSYTDLFAPVDGIVLSTSAEAGEYLNPAAPVLTIGQTARPWLRAYINETDLGRVKLNQDVKVTTDSYPDRTYNGRISFISSEAEFTPKAVQTFEERVKLMYRIKIDLQNPENELKPGMPADAVIDFSER